MADAILSIATATGLYKGGKALLDKPSGPQLQPALANGAQPESVRIPGKEPLKVPGESRPKATDSVVEARKLPAERYTYGEQLSSSSSYRFKIGVDMDFRGTNKSVREALDIAFQKTGVPKEYFHPSQYAIDIHGKRTVVEWSVDEGPYRGAQVNIDFEHFKNPDAPHILHVGWQTPGKSHIRGHIFLDKIYAGRTNVKE